MKRPQNELDVSELRNICDPSLIEFESTDVISPEAPIIGQDRALAAIDFGINIDSEGFNIYVSGYAGTGRNTAILESVKKIALEKRVPDDICYIYNFIKPDEPRSLKLPAGLGYSFKRDMDSFTSDLEKEVKKVFLSEDYEKHKKEIVDRYDEKKEALELELNEFARSKGFALQQTLTGLVAVPVYNGHPIKEEEYERLSDDEKSGLKQNEDDVYQKLYDTLRSGREFERGMKDEVRKLDSKAGLYSIGHLIDDLKKKYASHTGIVRYLNEVQDDILKNLDALKKEPEARELPFLAEASGHEKETIINRYHVNLIIDNCDMKGAPVVVETNPTYYNITGQVEYRAQFGILTTDFMHIKAGSAHKASGGFLIMQAHELFMDYFAWDALKKILRYKQIKIENLAERYGVTPTTGLKPEPVPVDLKVIIVGNPIYYHLLYIYDEDFRKLFKVKADFDTTVKRTDDFLRHYALFVARKCADEKTLPFGRDAVAKVIDYGTRLASHKDKLSTRFQEVTDIIRQSDYWARREDAKVVLPGHVKKAIEEKVYRSNMVEKKIQELFEEGTLFVDTDGTKTGQINGMSVIDLGDHAFGMPSRITARTFLGRGSIMNIEREVKMSGRIHSKGVLILSGYLGHKFARNKPLALSASIAFEQLYEEVEGDSASSAELYCLISSIAEIPLKQGIAVTGSVNQLGRVQPIGGVNEKIEGFYEVCKLKGLTSLQGVMIPRSNIKHIMLKDEVVDAVKGKKFHIYAVDTIEEGISILTGMPAGCPGPMGKYPKGTVFNKVDSTLSKYASLMTRVKK